MKYIVYELNMAAAGFPWAVCIFTQHKEKSMFGFSGGETLETAERKTGYRTDAMKKWPFLTMIDLGSIKTEGQLRNLVKILSSIPDAQAEEDVKKWMRGKIF